MGESVIIDATWGGAGQRAAAAAAAERVTADLVQLRCTAPAEVAAARIRSRTGSASDADPRIAALLAAAEEPWPQAVSLDAGGEEAGLLDAGPAALARQAPAVTPPPRPL